MRKPVAVVAVLAVLLVAGCASFVRLAYNNGDYMLRVTAHEYFDLHDAQSDQLKVQLARFHEWHRNEQLPLYARGFRSAGERIARGLTPADVVWAMDDVRNHYRVLVSQAADEGAPVLATLTPDNLAALERKFADVNTKFAKEYLAGDQAKRDRARAKQLEGRFEMFMGDLTAEQRKLIAGFVQAQPRTTEARFEERKRRQQAFARLLAEHRADPDLAARLRDFLVYWDREWKAENVALTRAWEDGLVDLILAIDRTLTPEQRAHVVAKFESYANDCLVLARQGRPAGEVRAAAGAQQVH